MTSTAVAAASWGRAKWKTGLGLAALPGPLMSPAGNDPDGGTGDTIGLKVEIYLGGLGWVDISPYVYYRDRIHISSRGRPDETSQVQPQTATMTINNRDGRFSPRNPAGPYYGLLTRNTPLRISRLNNGVRRFRFAGEVSAWPVTWDVSGSDVYSQITASGPLRRLFQGTQPLRSPMFRAMTSGVTSSLVTAYWPCEDAAGATSLASGLPGGSPMTFTVGSPQLAQDTSFVCSAPLPQVNESTWTGAVPLSSNTTANVFRFLISIPAAGEPNVADICRMTTLGTVARAEFAYDSATGEVQFAGWDATGNVLFGVTSSFSLNGAPARISMELIQAGSNITWALVMLYPGATSAPFLTGSIAGTVGPATSLIINPHISTAPLGLSTTVIGHVSYQPTWDSLFDLFGPMYAWLGEPPDAIQPNNSLYTTSRFTRLCLEQNVTPVVVTSAAGYDADPGPVSPVGMGYQTIDTLPTLLQQVPDTTAGMMFEPRDQVGVAIRTRASLYNQTPLLTLDYAQSQLSAPLNPVDDDQLTRNDITVTRVNGSSAIVQQATGSLSIQAPPNGVGDYATQYQLSLASDSLLADAAGWRLHMGTVDEPRYPSISLNLRHPTFTSSVDMMNAALTMDIGDRVVINNPPPWMPPDQISLIVQGYNETLGIYEHDMTIVCSPESPYRIGLLEDPVLGHADTDGSALDVPISGADGTFTVATTGAAIGSPIWTTSAGDFPFDVNVGGERITVPGITGSSSPQFFTNVIRNVNGVPAALGADGTFETGATGWTPTSGTFAVSTAQAHSGTRSGLLTVTGSPSQTFVRTPFIPVTPGAAIAATQWVKTASGSPNCLCVIDFFDASQNYLSTFASAAVAAPSAWTAQQALTTVPSGAVYVQIGPTMNLSPAAGTAIYVDDVTLTTPPSHPAGTDVRLWQPMILSL